MLLNKIVLLLILTGLILNTSCSDDKTAKIVPTNKSECEESTLRCNAGRNLELCQSGQWQNTESCKLNERCDLADSSEQKSSCTEIPLTNFEKISEKEFIGTVQDLYKRNFFDSSWSGCMHFKHALEQVKDHKINYNAFGLKPFNKGLNHDGLKGLSRCILDSMISSLKLRKDKFPELVDIGMANTTIKESPSELYYHVNFVSNGEAPLKMEFMITNSVPQLYSVKGQIFYSINPKLGLHMAIAFFPGEKSINNSTVEISKLAETFSKAMNHFYFIENFSSSTNYCMNKEFTSFLKEKFNGLKRHPEFLQCDKNCQKNVSKTEAELYSLVQSQKQEKHPIKLNANQIELFEKSSQYVLCHTLMENLSYDDKTLDKQAHFRPLLPSLRLNTNNMLEIMRQSLGEHQFAEMLFAVVNDTRTIRPLFASGFNLVNPRTLDELMQNHRKMPIDSPAVLEVLPYWMNKNSTKAIEYILGRINNPKISNANKYKLQVILASTLIQKSVDYFYNEIKRGKTSDKVLNKLLNHADFQDATIKLLSKYLLSLNDNAILEVCSFIKSKVFLPTKDQPLVLVPSLQRIMGQTQNFYVYYNIYETLKQIENNKWHWPQRPVALHMYVRSDPADIHKDQYKQQTLTEIEKAEEPLITEVFKYADILPAENMKKMQEILILSSASNTNIPKVCRRIAQMKKSPKLKKLAMDVLNGKR